MSMNDSLLFVMKEVLSTVGRLSCLLLWNLYKIEKRNVSVILPFRKPPLNVFLSIHVKLGHEMSILDLVTPQYLSFIIEIHLVSRLQRAYSSAVRMVQFFTSRLLILVNMTRVRRSTSP